VPTDDSSGAPKRRRLSRSGDFDRVYREGSSAGNRFLVLYTFGGSDEGREHGRRLGISVGRKVGKAVQRNRVKRAVREAFWALAEDLPADHDYVIVARPGSHDLVEREGADGVRRSLEELLGEAKTDESV
jgi:ribonuclease P protein component